MMENYLVKKYMGIFDDKKANEFYKNLSNEQRIIIDDYYKCLRMEKWS